MKRMCGEPSDPAGQQGLPVLLLFFMVAMCVFHLGSAAAGYPLFRDIHLGTALEYAKGRIDLLHPVIVGFNATQTPTPQELPLWQAAAALAFKLFGPWYGWGNVVSLCLFLSCLFPLWAAARMFAGARCAWWTCICFLAQPLVFHYGGEAGTDGFCLAGTIWFFYCAASLLQQPTLKWWGMTVITGGIAAVSKLPFFMAAGLAVAFLVWMRHRKNRRVWLQLGSAALLIIAAFLWWSRHADRCYALAEFPFRDLRLSNPEARDWFLGDLNYRLSPGNWVKGGYRVLCSNFGSFALAGLFLYALFLVKEAVVGRLWLLGAILTTLIFTKVVLVHRHYYLMYAPAFALLCAHAITELEVPFWDKVGRRRALVLIAITLFLSTVQGFFGMEMVLSFDPYAHRVAAGIRQHSGESDKLLIHGGDWGGRELITSGRRGLSINDLTFLDNPGHLARLKELGFTKLVMISESPVLTATQQVNPGGSQLTRKTYRPLVTPQVQGWPTIVQSEDILIKQIP